MNFLKKIEALGQIFCFFLILEQSADLKIIFFVHYLRRLT